MTPPPALKRGPKFLREAYNALRDYVLASRPVRSETCEVNETPDGTQILPQAPGGGGRAGVSRRRPWEIIAGSSPGTVRLEPYAQLADGEGGEMAVDSLDGQFEAVEGYLLYLRLTYSVLGEITDASVIYGEPWTDYPVRIAATGDGEPETPFIIEYSYLLLGYTVLATDTTHPPGVLTGEGEERLNTVSCVYTPLELQPRCVDGVGVVRIPVVGTEAQR